MSKAQPLAKMEGLSVTGKKRRQGHKTVTEQVMSMYLGMSIHMCNNY